MSFKTLNPYHLVDFISCSEKFKRTIKGNSTEINNRVPKAYTDKRIKSTLSKKLIKEYFYQIYSNNINLDINTLWYEFKESNPDIEVSGKLLLWVLDKIKNLPGLIPQATSILDVDYPVVYEIEGIKIKFKIDAIFISDRTSQVRPVMIWDYKETSFQPSGYQVKYFGQLVSEAFKEQIKTDYPSKKIVKGYLIRPDTWTLLPFPLSLKEKNLLPSVIKSINNKIYFPVPSYANCVACPFNIKGGCSWRYQ